MSKYKKLLFITLSAAFFLSLLAKNAQAQRVDLGISPPLTELVIKPGAKYTARFLLSNFSDSDTVLYPYLYMMSAADELGTAEIADNPEGESSPVYHWFTINNTKLNDAGVRIRQGNTSEVPVAVSVPEDVEEIDYYYTLVFASAESVRLPGSGQTSQPAIASNLLISVSETGLPEKNALVEEFKAPKIVDSFFPITFKVRVKNSGNSFFKPIGDIRTTGYFLDSTLNLAPQNILSGTIREIKCLDDEDLVECKVDSTFLVGKYTSELSFTLDEEGRRITQTQETVALPVVASFGIWVLWFAYSKIRGKNKSL